MVNTLHTRFLLPLLAALLPGAASAQLAVCPQRDSIFVRAGPDMTTPVEGRLTVWAKQASGSKRVGMAPVHREGGWTAVADIRDWVPDTAVKVPQSSALAGAFSDLPSGAYELQAVLHVDHSDNGGGRSPRTWISDVVTLADHRQGCMDAPVLKLVRRP